MRHIPLLVGTSHECSYLPGRTARLAFVDPRCSLNTALYSSLADQGFRRSGDMVYRPHCVECQACTPIRVPVAHFAPSRIQSRVLKRNLDLQVSVRPAEYSEEHFQLYQRYLNSRHGDGEMADSTPEQFMEFLASGWSDTAFVEFRDRDELQAVAVVDRLERGLSAVYTFFEPDRQARSLGACAVLWQIQEARRLGLDWVYLGYWIGACRKMSYKDQYRPLQALIDGQWRRHEKGEKIPN